MSALTAEQTMLQGTLRRFLSSKSTEGDVREAMASEDGYDRDVWRLMGVELGVQGIAIPESLGGAGLGGVELCIAAYELGRNLTCVPHLGSSVLAATTLLTSGSESLRSRYLPGLADGSVIGCLAASDRTADVDVEDLATTARPLRTDMWEISGSKAYVIGGAEADFMIVAANTTDGIGLFVVDPRSAWVTRRALSTMDMTRGLAAVELAQAHGELVGSVAKSLETLARVRLVAAAVVANEAAGGAERALEMALAYAQDRYQFGRPIGSFQSIKHMCAEMLLEVEAAKSAAQYAARCLDEAQPDGEYAVHVAKAYCADAFMRVAADNVQIHGGIGFTWEYAAQLYYKRAKSDQLLIGSSRMHRQRAAVCLETMYAH